MDDLQDKEGLYRDARKSKFSCGEEDTEVLCATAVATAPTKVLDPDENSTNSLTIETQAEAYIRSQLVEAPEKSSRCVRVIHLDEEDGLARAVRVRIRRATRKVRQMAS